MSQGTPDKGAAAHRRPLSLSEIVERLLARSTSDHSSVSLWRNARGETQIEVVVRSSEAGSINTVYEAARECERLYDELRARYPLLSGLTSATPVDDTKRSSVAGARSEAGAGRRRSKADG